MSNKNDHTYKRWLTPDQIQTIRLTLFASAAASMGARVEALEQAGDTDGLAAVIRSEWVVKD